MEPIYIFGHKNPDTDAVCASIAYSYLKNKLGQMSEPRIIGHLNKETKFVLEYFNFPEPSYLAHTKIQVKDLKYNKTAMINNNANIEETLKLLLESKGTGIPLVDDTKRISGYINIKDLAKSVILEGFNTKTSISEIATTKNPICVDQYDYLNDFNKIISRHGHSNYPVINNRGQCVGLVSIKEINNYNKKQVILVDHNNFLQSIDGIEEANILEIIDHHNIGSIGTNSPINFRIMPVGSTCTIIHAIFSENKIKIPKNIAGLMLAAIISDTLEFKSPTTTQMDIEVAYSLAKLAKIDIKKFSLEMFNAGSSLDNMDLEEILYSDYKDYKIGDDDIFLSQILTLDFKTIENQIDSYVEGLNKLCQKNYKYAIMCVTDIKKNGSYLVYSDSAKKLITEIYDLENIKQGIFIPGLVSRKKQLVPNIFEVLK